MRAFLCVQARLGCNSELILDEFGEKLLEELDYQQEARNIEVGAHIFGSPCTQSTFSAVYEIAGRVSSSHLPADKGNCLPSEGCCTHTTGILK